MVDAAVADLASQQYGLFSRPQAIAVGAGTRLIETRLGSGRWTHEADAVYGLPGWPDSWMRRIWRGYLATGAHAGVFFETAAALHELTGFPRGRIVLTTPHGDHHWHGLCEMRQHTALLPEPIVVLRGLRVTSVVRALFDLAAFSGRDRLAIAIEDAHITGCCRLEMLQEFYDALRRPGKRGMKMLS